MSTLKITGGTAGRAPQGGLLAPDEPRPFELFNAAGSAPLLLLCDHATRFIPRALDSLGLDAAALTRHIAWDLGIAEVTRQLARQPHAPAVLRHFSRLVVTPNLRLNTTTERNSVRQR